MAVRKLSIEPIEIPRDNSLDSTLSLVKEGYCFLGNRHRRLQSDIFETRLMLRKTISITGREAAVLFYNPEYFQRHGATPERIQKTLFGKNGVQSLDGAEHRHRKAMFMSLMTTAQIENFLDFLTAEWEFQIIKWHQMGNEVNLFTEAQDLLCRSACIWAGVPLAEGEVRRRARDMHRMIAAFGAIGPRHWAGRRARDRSERWAARIIRQIRDGAHLPPMTSAASVIARHRDTEGRLLPVKIAAVELLNIIRPIVAISRYVVFSALALQAHPDYRDRIIEDDDQADIFVQEVRRLYPFTPFLGAITRKDFTWRGYYLPENTRVLLDVYGINHDPRIWPDPDAFIPERFLNWKPNAYNFIPQGGGDFMHGHRCAGEWVTIEAMKISAAFLATIKTSQLPAQASSLDMAHMPTAPDSGFIVRFP